jgi:hypothetical protein
MDVQAHLEADTLECYVLGQISVPGAKAAEEHLLGCRRCRYALVQAERYVSTMRAALLDVDWIIAIHRMQGGAVALGVGKSGDDWAARVYGCSVNAGEVARTYQGAVGLCESLFGQLFPEHVCTAKCRTDVRRWAT